LQDPGRGKCSKDLIDAGFRARFQRIQKKTSRPTAQGDRPVAGFPSAGNIPIPERIGIESPGVDPAALITNVQPRESDLPEHRPEAAPGLVGQAFFFAAHPEQIAIQAFLNFQIRTADKKERPDFRAQGREPRLPASVPQRVFERARRKNDERGSEFFFRHVSGKRVWIGGAAKFQPSLRALKKTKAAPGEEIRGNVLVLRVALPRRSAPKCRVNQQGAER
jgi:hypothetical protein